MAAIAAAAAVVTVLGGVAFGVEWGSDRSGRAASDETVDGAPLAPLVPLAPLAPLAPTQPKAPARMAKAGTVPQANSDPNPGTAPKSEKPSAAADSAPLAPPVPVLAVYLPTPGAVTAGGDRRASLRATRVSAGSGGVASVAVRYTGASQAMTPDTAGDYTTVVTGLTNGTVYSITVRVCNTDGRCTDSAPLSYTPYGTPQAGSVSLTAVNTDVTLAWTASVSNAFPFRYDCTITLTSSPADPSAPPEPSIGHGAGSWSFAGRPNTTYEAIKSCGNGRSTSVARSGSVQTAEASAAPPDTASNLRPSSTPSSTRQN